MQTQLTAIATPQNPFCFQDGAQLDDLVVAWKSWGKLNSRQDNVILLFPVLTTSHHAAGFDPQGPNSPWWTSDCYQGWWDEFIGPGKALDTRRWHVICASFLGGCYGTTGPSSLDPKTGKVWGDRFPYPHVSDLVDAQVRLLDALGIHQLKAIVGGSFGGYLALDFALRYPLRTQQVVSIASGLRVTEAMKLSNFQQIMAIEFHGERLSESKIVDQKAGVQKTKKGLELARMIAMQQYIVADEIDTYCRQSVDPKLKDQGQYSLRHPVESWLLYQGQKFSQRFDPQSYLRLLYAWQNWHPALKDSAWEISTLLNSCRQQQWLLFSIDSDACFPVQEQMLLAQALTAAGVPHKFVSVASRLGHDSFLREPKLYQWELQAFLEHQQPPLPSIPVTGGVLVEGKR